MADLLFVTRVLSPFQINLFRQVRATGVDARITVVNGGIGTRPKHWDVEVPEWVTVDDFENPRTLRKHLQQVRPRCIVHAGYYGSSAREVVRTAPKLGAGLVFWLEQPLAGPTWRGVAKEPVIGRLLATADVLLCIGPRSLAYYQRLVGDGPRMYCLPYGDDLAHNTTFERDWTSNEPLVFLFSGKLVQRNNIWEMLSAFREVRQRNGDSVRLSLSGYAGFEPAVREECRRDPILRASVTWDVEFDTWDDRLRPFKNAHVKLIPGLHAGWGLIVPEAMSLGMPIIGTTGIESVRALVRSGRNGFVVEPMYTDIAEAMQRFVDDRTLVETLGKQARIDAMACDSVTVARRMVTILAPWLEIR